MNSSNTSSNLSPIEIINSRLQRGHVRYALFDFDGTISLIREGWQSIMIPMMVEILEHTPHPEGHDLIEKVVKDFVTQLTGKQTIYQMIQLCDEIRKRGGEPNDPLFYKNMYNERLNEHIKERIKALKSGAATPQEMAVPGAFEWLEILKNRGIHCYLASGTDEKFVFEESEMLGLPPYFDGIYGAKDDYKTFSKKMVIDRIIQEHHLHGSEFSAYGDGYVEIEDSKSAGGIAVGVATNESERCGIDEWKRSRLIAAGADLIIPDFSCASALEKYLFGEE
jgi:phosphoglycolate phosphatase